MRVWSKRLGFCFTILALATFLIQAAALSGMVDGRARKVEGQNNKEMLDKNERMEHKNERMLRRSEQNIARAERKINASLLKMQNVADKTLRKLEMKSSDPVRRVRVKGFID